MAIGDLIVYYPPTVFLLDLYAESGFLAIREAGLWDSMMKHAGYEGEDCITSDKHERAFMSIKPVDEGVPPRSEIDRKQSREVMMIVYFQGRHPLRKLLTQHKQK